MNYNCTTNTCYHEIYNFVVSQRRDRSSIFAYIYINITLLYTICDLMLFNEFFFEKLLDFNNPISTYRLCG